MRKPIINPALKALSIAAFLLVYLLIILGLIKCTGGRSKDKADTKEQAQKNEIEQYHLAEGRNIKFIEEITNN